MKTMLLAGIAALVCATPDDDLDKACAKAAEMGKYGFKLTTKIEGMKGADSQPLEVKVDKDLATEIKGQQTSYKKGETLVIKEGEEWKKYERTKPAQGDKEARRAGAAMAMLAGLRVPHEILADFGKKLKEVKKAEEKENDCAVYSGDLTDEAAKELGAMGKGKNAGDLSYSGSAKLWINAEGAIVKFELNTAATGTVKEKDINIKATRTYEIGEVGTVKIEIPEEVLKILGAP